MAEDLVETRNDKGQFLPGKSGNPAGRPKGKKNQITELKQDLELAVRDKMSPVKIQSVVDKMVELALDGNVGAAKLILDKTIANVKDADDVQEGSGGFTFVIKNATITAPSSTEDGNVIDVTPEHVE